MKKEFLTFALILVSPVYALCPVNENSVCTLPETGQNVSPIFMQNNSNNSINNTKPSLQPMTQVNPIDNMKGPNNPLNYDSGCQFGNCLENPNNRLMPQK